MPAANATMQGIGETTKKRDSTARAERSAQDSPIFEQLVIPIETHQAFEFVDITALLGEAVRTVGLQAGLMNVWTRHTTTGLLVNESEPLLLGDLAAMFERLVPISTSYRHDDFTQRTVNLTANERRNGHAHCRAALLRTSESVSVVDGRLALGRWQRVFLVEFDGGQRRELGLTMTGYA
jgi:secondary thiamine-phosphate synthase enzyme